MNAGRILQRSIIGLGSRGALLSFCVVLQLFSVALQATPYTSNYKDKLKAADLVVIGKTKSIQNRDQSDGDNVNVFTDITIEVTRVIKGKMDSSSIMLTFVGGWHESKFYQVAGSAANLFEVGDEDLLFISNSKAIPVDDGGKLPIVNGEIFDGRGHQFSIVDGQMKKFKSEKKIKNNVKTKNPKTGTELVLGYESKQIDDYSPDAGSKSNKTGLKEKELPLDVDSFVKELVKGGRP